MVGRANKPSALATTPGLAPQPQVEISDDNSRISAKLPTGESIDVLLYGATIISWKTGNGEEKLWLSDAAKLDGSKAVRGGIPLVFPVFGQDPSHAPTSKLPQHGFARTSRWEYLGKSTSESPSNSISDAGVKLDFGLSPSNLDSASKAAWPEKFGLIYSISLSRDGLETTMLVRNEGDTAWDFQMLLHSYFKVQDINSTTVSGLDNAVYIDKVDSASTKTETHTALPITSETDRVYTPAGGPKTPLTIHSASKPVIQIVRDNLENAVVWNPWAEKSKGMADFEPKDGFNNMLCVEAGQVAGWTRLEGGDSFEGGQFIKAQL